jgi:hypothetical protein
LLSVSADSNSGMSDNPVSIVILIVGYEASVAVAVAAVNAVDGAAVVEIVAMSADGLAKNDFESWPGIAVDDVVNVDEDEDGADEKRSLPSVADEGMLAVDVGVGENAVDGDVKEASNACSLAVILGEDTAERAVTSVHGSDPSEDAFDAVSSSSCC